MPVSTEPPTSSTQDYTAVKQSKPIYTGYPPNHDIYILQINRVAGKEVPPSQTAPYCESRKVGKRLQINKYINKMH